MSGPCVTCGSTNTRRDSIPLTILGVEIEQPGTRCNVCDEFYSMSAECEAVDLRVAAVLADRAPCPKSFRYMRHAIGLSGVECASLIGVQPETVSRWENGRRAMNRIAWNYVAAKVREAARCL
jgi:DNA-binding transcriptional regulator YiaG